MELPGKGIVLTGASSGIGRDLAHALGARGARLVLVARRETRLREVADAIAAAGGTEPIVLVADLGHRGAAADVARRARAELGTVDVLVNNAGGGVGGLQHHVGDRDEARDAFELNFWSPLALAAALVPDMLARRSGTVVNVTSLAQVMTWPMLGHYAASKAALALATETLRLELAHTDVDVIEVIPGPVATAIQGETALVPGIERALARAPMGSPAALADRIVTAIERGTERVVYPRRLAPSYVLPGLTRRYVSALNRRGFDGFDLDDARVLRTGSFGAAEVRAARDEWEQRHQDSR